MAYNSGRSRPGRSDSTLYNESTGEIGASKDANTNDSYNYGDESPTGLPPPNPPFAQPGQRISFAPPKNTGDLRIWRHGEREGMWTKGGKGKVFLRFCCCTGILAIFLIVSIILALAMWARPPDITFNGIQLPTNSSAVSVQANSLDIFLSLSIGVKNPNFFGASFKSIVAKAFYPPLTAQLGGGSLYNIDFPANSDTQFLFPFDVNYSMAIDPQNILVQDLVNKCGIKTGSTKQPLTVKYDLTLSLRIIVLTISPSFSGTASFDCPVTRNDLETLGGAALLQSLGVD